MRLLPAVLPAALFAAAAALPATAQVFEPGDIVIPGNRVVDSWGNVSGCFYRLRGGTLTRWFETNAFRSPADMIVDGQGRLVFWASPLSRNVNDSAIFRLDPATGALERILYFPYIVAAGDTLPEGAESAASFYGSYNQALHLEKSLVVTIDDAVNGGWPQVSNEECYGFSIGTSSASGPMPSTYRYRPGRERCEPGVPAGLLPWSGPVYMAADGSNVYYGLHNLVGRTKPAARLDVQLAGDWGSFLATLLAQPPKNELVVSAQVFDNTQLPNGSATCQPFEDHDVPYNPGGGFSVLSMSGLGVLDGSLYALSNSGATGVPYVFGLSMRAPFLNPYVCQYTTACQGSGPLSFWLQDGTPTAMSLSTVDGGALLGVGNGVLKRVTTGGGYEQLASSGGDVQLTGRPWRWPSGGAPAAAAGPAAGTGPLAAAAADSGAQVLVVRSDARVHVLLTDALGRRVGFDAAGNAVNEVGPSAQALAAGPGSWPELVVLRDPDPGTFAVELAATEAGDWGVKAYLGHESAGGVLRPLAGSAAGGELRGLHVGRPLELTWYSSPTTGVGDGPAGRGFVSVGPVPSRASVRFAYRVPEGGARVRLEVFDLLGRRVASPLDAAMPAGAHALDWNGTLADGRRLGRGVYLVRLDVGGRPETRRIVLTD